MLNVVKGKPKLLPLPVGQVVRQISAVKQIVEAAKFVLVAFVVVLFKPVKFWKVEEAVANILAKVPKFTEALVEKSVAANKFVVVAEVPVAFMKVKF